LRWVIATGAGELALLEVGDVEELKAVGQPID